MPHSARKAVACCLVAFGWGASFATAAPTFDGQRAFQYLAKQCEFGPRNPGSEGHQKCLAYLAGELEKCCDEVSQQKFTYTDKKNPGKTIEGTNLIASVNPNAAKKGRVLLCAHWDTRPFADKDPNPADRNRPILGANDGASGVAVLLEMAQVLKANAPDVAVDIVLFDLEDMGDYDAERNPEGLNPFCIGSEYFAAHNKTEYRFGILLDMIGDKDLAIRKEAISDRYAPEIVKRVWDSAKRVGAKAFVNEGGAAITDDHVPFLKRGIRVVDLIDFDYRPWHTLADTAEKCSADSLQQIGDVLVDVIYGE